MSLSVDSKIGKKELVVFFYATQNPSSLEKQQQQQNEPPPNQSHHQEINTVGHLTHFLSLIFVCVYVLMCG